MRRLPVRMAVASLALLGASCAEPVTIAAHLSPNLSLLEPFDGRPVSAPAVHRDWFNGYSFDVPAGWVMLNPGWSQNYAPAPESLHVYPDWLNSQRRPELFSIMSRVFRPESAEERARDASRSAVAQSPVRRMAVAGRPAFRIDGPQPWGWSSTVFVQWDDETVAMLMLTTHRVVDREERVRVFESVVDSMRESERDRHAGNVRAFLEARVAGHGAEHYLAPGGEAFYARKGLYRTDNCGRIRDYNVASVVHDPELGTLYQVQAGDAEVLQMVASPWGRRSIRDAVLMQSCATS